jgi:hypothetical protein
MLGSPWRTPRFAPFPFSTPLPVATCCLGAQAFASRAINLVIPAAGDVASIAGWRSSQFPHGADARTQ